MNVECQRCLNVNSFDTLLQKPIRISSNGSCNQCIEWEKTFPDLENYRINAQKQLSKIFKKIKQEKHQYDALVSLSGGKDSSAALILAKEKYNLNILAFTTDKGNFYDGVKENMNQLTDRLGIDHVLIRTPKPLLNRLFRFGITTLSTGGIQCKICGGLVHLPILNKFLLNNEIPIIITGLDLWEIQVGTIFEKNKCKNLVNPFLYTFPTQRERWNKYNMVIGDCLDLLKRFSEEEKYLELKKELIQISNELISRYGLSSTQIEEFNKMEFYDIGLTGIEITSKKQQLQLLDRYGWTPPKDLFTGEIIGTDCKIGGVINAITSFKQKRKMWSYRIRSGLVTKEEALNEINRKKPNIDKVTDTVKEIGLKSLENHLTLGWQNHIYKELYNLEVIKKIEERLNHL